MAVFEQKSTQKLRVDDTAPLTCTIEASHNVNDHTEYVIRVQRGPVPENKWTVSRRYSEFAALEAEMKISGIELPFPPKKILGKMDREFVAERQQGLQTFLKHALANHLLANCIQLKMFLDPKHYININMQETALQHISMFFRSEPKWEVVEPAPNIGWRLRKNHFLIRNKETPRDKYILSWSNFGLDKSLLDKDLEYLMKQLPTFHHPYLFPVTFASSNDTCSITVRPFWEDGSLRDIICKARPRYHFLKKYGCPRQVTLIPLHEIRLYGRQVLETLKYLRDKGLPAGGHIHAGNIIVDGSRCRLLDYENGLIGVPALHRSYFTQYRRIQTLELLDVYVFGHLMYEMALGAQLHAACCDTFPPQCPPEIRSVLESILTTEACKNGLPSIEDLLTHPLFSEVILPPPADKPVVKVGSRVKEALREAAAATTRHLNEEQKVIHQYKRLSKAQAFHMSDAEKKKRRKTKRKQLSTQDQPVSNGEVRSDVGSPTPTSSAAPPSTASSPPPPPPAPPILAACPPLAPPSSVPTSPPASADSGRNALLSSIQGFNKIGLKPSQTGDK